MQRDTENTPETQRKHQPIAWSPGDTHATEALIPSVLDTPSPTTPDNRPHHHAGPPKTTAPSRTTPRSPRTSLRVLHAGTDGRRGPSTLTLQYGDDRAACRRPGRAGVGTGPAPREGAPRPTDRSRCGTGPISTRVSTDLDAEYDRSRCGVRPISMRSTTDLGERRGRPEPAGSG